MANSTTFVIIGGGLAGAKAAEALRNNDFDGNVILFAEERHLPYERPPLSKDYLAGKKSLSDFTVQNSDWYRDHNVDLRLGSRVTSLDPAAHTVGLPDGTAVTYDKLLLATGSASRRPPPRAKIPRSERNSTPRRRRRCAGSGLRRHRSRVSVGAASRIPSPAAACRR